MPVYVQGCSLFSGYRSPSNGLKNVMSVIDHLTRFQSVNTVDNGVCDSSRAVAFSAGVRGDVTVEHFLGKLNVVPDALSRLFGEIEPEPLSQKPTLACICRHVPGGRPLYPPGPREREIPARTLDEVDTGR